MAGVEIATQGWGTILEGDITSENFGKPVAGVSPTITTLGNVAATIYNDRALTTPLVGAFQSNEDGLLPGFIAKGTYKLTEPEGTLRYVEAAAGAAQVSRSVAEYGAAGDGTTDDLAAFTAADAACVAAGGGEVFMPGGGNRYAVSAPIVLSEGVNLKGESTYSTTIVPLSDFGGYVVDADCGPGGFAQNPYLSDFTIEGPVNPPLGPLFSPGAATHGLRLVARGVAERVRVRFCNTGILMEGDHNTIRDCWANDNMNGVSVDNSAVGNFGDQTIDNCRLDGNRRASLKVPAGSRFAGSTIFSTHFGFGPYCLEAENGTASFIDDCIFIDCNFESWGNAAIFSADQSGSIQRTVFLKSGIGDPNNTYKIAASTRPASIYVKEILNTYFDKNSGIGSDGTAPCINASVEIDNVGFGDFNWLSDLYAGSAKLLDPAATCEVGYWFVQFPYSVIRRSNATVAANDLLEHNGVDRVRPWQGGLVAGRALNAAASGEVVISQTSGPCSLNVNSGSIAGNSLLKPDATNHGKVVTSTGYADPPVIGYCRVTSTSPISAWLRIP